MTEIKVGATILALFLVGLFGVHLLNLTVGPSYNTRQFCREWAKSNPEEFRKDE
jgi:hypothetical protein